jgi:hypothetical protein
MSSSSGPCKTATVLGCGPNAKFDRVPFNDQFGQPFIVVDDVDTFNQQTIWWWVMMALLILFFVLFVIFVVLYAIDSNKLLALLGRV